MKFYERASERNRRANLDEGQNSRQKATLSKAVARAARARASAPILISFLIGFQSPPLPPPPSPSLHCISLEESFDGS